MANAVKVVIERASHAPLRTGRGPWEFFTAGTVFETTMPRAQWPSWMKEWDEVRGAGPDAESVGPPEPQTLSQAAGGEDAILFALNQLDHDNDAHWTKQGFPLMDAVNELIEHGGGKRITAEHVRATAPDFLRRS